MAKTRKSTLERADVFNQFRVRQRYKSNVKKQSREKNSHNNRQAEILLSAAVL